MTGIRLVRRANSYWVKEGALNNNGDITESTSQGVIGNCQDSAQPMRGTGEQHGGSTLLTNQTRALRAPLVRPRHVTGKSATLLGPTRQAVFPAQCGLPEKGPQQREP